MKGPLRSPSPAIVLLLALLAGVVSSSSLYGTYQSSCTQAAPLFLQFSMRLSPTRPALTYSIDFHHSLSCTDSSPLATLSLTGSASFYTPTQTIFDSANNVVAGASALNIGAHAINLRVYPGGVTWATQICNSTSPLPSGLAFPVLVVGDNDLSLYGCFNVNLPAIIPFGASWVSSSFRSLLSVAGTTAYFPPPYFLSSFSGQPTQINTQLPFALIALDPADVGPFTDPVDQAILVDFWHNLENTGKLGWNTSASLCGQSTIRCNSQGKVTSIWFSADFVVGTIPRKWGGLTALEGLSFAGSGFTGTVPTELGNCKNLTTMTLQDTRFFGPLPTELRPMQWESLQLWPKFNNFCPEVDYSTWIAPGSGGQSDYRMSTPQDYCRGCVGAPCQNGGVCSAEKGFACLCPADWEGPQCADPVSSVNTAALVTGAILGLVVVALAAVLVIRQRKAGGHGLSAVLLESSRDDPDS